jgi:tetratricopeptide (TPR) repeat protein
MGSGVTAAEGLSEARALWRSLGNKPMLCFCLSLSAEVHTYLGELDSALVMVQESLDMSTAIGNAEGLAYACTMMGSIYAMRGDAGTAIDLLHQGIDTANSTSSGILALISVYILSSLYGTIGACDQALALKEELVQTGMMQKMPPLFVAQMLLETGGADRACTDPHSYLESTAAIVQQALERNSGIAVEQWAGASLAAAHLAVGEPEAALNHIDQFLTLSTQNNWRTRTAEALELRARVLRALGRPDEEAATLAEARQLADEIGLANVQWRVVAALAENEDHKGNRDEAASLRREARAILNRIAESLTDPHLKRGLLAQPEVRALIRGGSAA